MELPESLKWINEVEDIDPAEGMRNCGQPQQYIKFIRTFFDTLENRIKEIRDAFDSEDIKTYTIKVHSLKSTARIMGQKSSRTSQRSWNTQEMKTTGKRSLIKLRSFLRFVLLSKKNYHQ